MNIKRIQFNIIDPIFYSESELSNLSEQSLTDETILKLFQARMIKHQSRIVSKCLDLCGIAYADVGKFLIYDNTDINGTVSVSSTLSSDIYGLNLFPSLLFNSNSLRLRTEYTLMLYSDIVDYQSFEVLDSFLGETNLTFTQGPCNDHPNNMLPFVTEHAIILFIYNAKFEGFKWLVARYPSVSVGIIGSNVFAIFNTVDAAIEFESSIMDEYNSINPGNEIEIECIELSLFQEYISTLLVSAVRHGLLKEYRKTHPICIDVNNPFTQLT